MNNNSNNPMNRQMSGTNEGQFQQRDTSFNDYIYSASSAHNLSFTQLQNNTSFEVEDLAVATTASPAQPPLSPLRHSSMYIPHSFLSKPFDDSNYENDLLPSSLPRAPSTSFRFEWNTSTAQESGGGTSQLAAGGGTSGASSAYWEHQSNMNNSFENIAAAVAAAAAAVSCPDGDIMHSSALMNSYGSVLGDQFIRGRPLSRQPQKSSHQQNLLSMDMMEEEAIDGFCPTTNNYEFFAESNFAEDAASSGFPKCPQPSSIVVDYDNYRKDSSMNRENVEWSSLHPRKNSSSTTFNHRDFSPIAKSPFNQQHLFSTVNSNNLTSTTMRGRRQLFADDSDFKYCSPLKTRTHLVTTPLGSHRFETIIDDNNENNAMNEEGNSAAGSRHNISSSMRSTSHSLPRPTSTSLEHHQANTNSSSQYSFQVLSAAAVAVAVASSSTAACICNCKKTKCLKLYCECFAKLGYCGEGCHCHSCSNRPEFEEERILAITEAKQRNPDAFQPRITACEVAIESQSLVEESSGGGGLSMTARKGLIAESLKKGCNCRRTKCLKKYCECFNAGAFCSQLCKCENCENHKNNPHLNNPNRRQTSNGGTTTHSSSTITTTTAPSTNVNNVPADSTFFPPTSNISSIGAPLSHTSAVSMLQYHMREMGPSSLVMPYHKSYADDSFSGFGVGGGSKLSSFEEELRISGQQGALNHHTRSSILGFANANATSWSHQQQSQAQSHSQHQTTFLQGKLLFENDNEDSSDQNSSQVSNSCFSNSSYSHSMVASPLSYSSRQQGKVKMLRKKGGTTKKPMIKSRGMQDHSDEDNSQQQLQDQRARFTRRIQNRSEAVMRRQEDDGSLLAQQLEDMEKKLRQIEQLQSVFQYQQKLKQEQQSHLQQPQLQPIQQQQQHHQQQQQQQQNHQQQGKDPSDLLQSIADEKPESDYRNLALQQEKQKFQQSIENDDRQKPPPSSQSQSQLQVETPKKDSDGNFEEDIEKQHNQEVGGDSIEKKRKKKRKRAAAEFSGEKKNHLIDADNYQEQQQLFLAPPTRKTSSLYFLQDIVSAKLSDNLFDPSTFHSSSLQLVNAAPTLSISTFPRTKRPIHAP